MQLLAEDELEDHRADAHRRQIRDNDGRDQIQRSDNRAQQHDQGQQHHEQCHRDDEPDVVLVVVAGVLQADGVSRHRYLGVRQRGVRLRSLGGREDRVDLIHGIGAERIEFGLHQVPHRVAVGRDEYLGGVLELVQVKQLRRDVESAHRRLRRVVLQRQQERRRLAEPGAQLLDLVDEQVDRVSDLPAATGELVGATLQLVQVRLQAAGLVHSQRLQHAGELLIAPRIRSVDALSCFLSG